jgi:hypothetical protein
MMMVMTTEIAVFVCQLFHQYSPLNYDYYILMKAGFMYMGTSDI